MKFAYAIMTSVFLVPACGSSTEAGSGAAESRLDGQQRVSGRVVFEPGSTIPGAWATTPVRGVVKLIDVTYQDGPSTDVASAPLTATSSDPIPFDLSLVDANVEPTHSYAVVAHLDVDGDGQTSEGDFMSMQSFPVLTQGKGTVVDVEIIRVGKPAVARSVSGNVVLAGDLTGLTFPFSGVVRVVDVTYEDAPSATVGSQTIGVMGPGPIPFVVPVTDVKATSRYAVQVHLDTDDDKAVSKGDFLTTERYSVLSEGHSSVIDVTAHRY